MTMFSNFILIAATVSGLYGPTAEKAVITQDELVHRTQELVDAIGVGNKAPWDKYLAADVIYFDEVGHKMDKAAAVANIEALPAGYSGAIKVVSPKALFAAGVAILAYDLDESEVVFGQKLTARYHETDTWLYREGRWQIGAGQIFRYYEDPAVGKIDASRLDEYTGTYQLAPGKALTVTRDGAHLYSKRGEGKPVELFPEVADLFFRRGVEGRQLFRRNASGKVDAILDRRNNEDLLWKKL